MICVHNFFLCLLRGCTHIFGEKKVVHAYFLEFGESFFLLLFQKKLQNDIKQRFLCALGVISKHSPNSLQTHMFSLFLIIFVYFAFVFSEKEE